MDSLTRKILCRESQLQTLAELFGEPDEPLPCSIFLSGSMSTGKSLCLSSVLNRLAYCHVNVNCIECYNPKTIFETILHYLKNCCEDEVDITSKCDNLRDFLNALNELKNNYQPTVIVFDKAERLRSMDPFVVAAFFRLKELCDLNICTVFVSHIIFENFYFKMGVREPIKVFFQNYTKEELFKIIFVQHKQILEHDVLENKPIYSDIRNELEKPELFANFLNAFLSVFYRHCRDLIELKHMARINFKKYCEPILKAEIQADDLTKLWRHISPILKANLELLYLRINTSHQQHPSPGKENTDSIGIEKTVCSRFDETLKEELTSTKTFAQSFELPYYAKYLLIAAYLASYNPPKEDKRLFMKNHGKQRKRLQQVRAKAKINEKLNTQLGPKMFTLDRLLAIFYAILEEKIGLTSNLLAQIASLVELKLIAGSKEIDLDSAKYKCIVGYDFITAIGQTVGFNVRKYLYDFI